MVVGEVGVWAQPAARNAAQINAYFTSASFNSRGGRVADQATRAVPERINQNAPN